MGTHATILLTTLLLAAIVSDLNARIIPNKLTIIGLLCGFLLSLLNLNGSIGWSESLLGCFTGLIFFLPIHLIGKMGAGDVKLLSMVGSYIGFEAVFMAGLCSLVAGGFLAIVWSSLCRRYHQPQDSAASAVTSVANDADNSMALRPDISLNINPGRILQHVLRDQRYPYAPAIALGVYLSNFLRFS